MTPLELLKKYFGYDSFRPLQKEIVEMVMAKKDVVTLMPTGSGKSVCFQIPAMAMEGTCLVVSPLIALMKDQVEGLKANGVKAAFLNSSLSENQEEEVIQKCLKGEIKLLYLSPEKTVSALNSFLSQLNLSLIAIDEAHCVSQWGHDFRPEYTRLKSLREKFPEVPIIALTATADKVTRKDIITQLALNNPDVFISSFDRPNLSLEVRAGVADKDKVKQIIDFINKKPGESGIIYCLSRNGTEKLSAQLNSSGISCAHYHAGMSSTERSRVQENFINDETPVICATIAFGMGIDKSNVRWVIHFNLPKNIEGYYQEIGRAGRDGLKSETVLYYSLKDIIMLNKFAMESGQSKLNMEKLKRMQQFSEAGICRRKILLNYFGETVSKDCGNCDVCHNPPQYIDGTILAQKALSAITRMGGSTGTTMLINVLRGSHNYEVIEKGYDKIKTYGAGKDLGYDAWYQYVLQLLQLGIIEMAYNENFSLKITPFGKMVLEGKTKINMVNFKPKEKVIKKAKIAKAQLSKENPNKENNLFEEFRQLRKQIAVSANLPPYIIFHDKTLHEMVSQLPCTKEEMIAIPGISEIKFEKYGKEFLNYINKKKQV
ncbi:MAG: DNA helicase RecQ [Bacteroidetes bacterium]|nr:DNA helicase RecQ [Bacteroidota bacterium]HET6244712.1 DNA helicase RecQ [Bacteroidia bacterium]